MTKTNAGDISPGNTTNADGIKALLSESETSVNECEAEASPQAKTISSESVTDSTSREVSAPQIATVPPTSMGWEQASETRYAKATALMDPGSIALLRWFANKDFVPAADIQDNLDGPAGWLKVAGLIRAGYLETLGSTVRITTEGVNALDMLQKVAQARGAVQ